MKILITGGTGLLGKSLIETAKKNVEIVATHLGRYDLKDTAHVKYRVMDVRDETRNAGLYKEFHPDITIHTAGIGSPDYAERHKKEAREINVGGTQNILRNCERFRSTFIYISSNGIYDGNNAPYDESSEAHPINYYGRIKLEGERVSGRIAIPCSIVRPILLYGWNHPRGRHNILTFALSKLEKGEEVFAYNDVFVNPIFAPACADAIWRIIEGEKYETFNIAGKDTVSIYRLVKSFAEVFDLNPNLVIPVQQGFFNELVKRPKNTSYDTGKMGDVLGIKPLSIHEGLSLMKKSLKRSI
jgi:dTDP-4-dehydrorhamnose reductase